MRAKKGAPVPTTFLSGAEEVIIETGANWMVRGLSTGSLAVVRGGVGVLGQSRAVNRYNPKTTGVRQHAQS